MPTSPRPPRPDDQGDASGQSLTLQDDVGLRLALLARGATWWSLQLPVPGEAQPRELLLGGATPQAHAVNTAYFGATIGRMANRIAGAQIERNGQRWALAAQPGSRHQLHGGPDGFDRRVWTLAEHTPRRAVYRLHSPVGDQGFPGAVKAEAAVTLPGGGVIDLQLSATTTAATPLCLTNHAYFNLDGARGDARAHRLTIAAAHVLPVDDELIPLGPLLPVAGTPFDFTEARPIGQARDGDYDHAYLLDGGPGLRPAARLVSGDGRVQLQIDTSLPALQLYTGAGLGQQTGRDGQPLPPHAGIALEPQFLPDSPHHPEWPQPSCWLEPGQTWRHQIRYTFSAA